MKNGEWRMESGELRTGNGGDNISEACFSTDSQKAEIDALLEQSRPEVRDQGKDDGRRTTEDGGK